VRQPVLPGALLAGVVAAGATLRAGRGRVAFFGEAAMRSAQRAGPERRPMGMNDPAAAQHPTFVLNVMHGLGGRLGASRN